MTFSASDMTDEPLDRGTLVPGRRTRSRRGIGAKLAAAVMSVLLGSYLLLTADRGMVFLTSGGVLAALMGMAVLAMPIIGVWVIVAEWRFGRAVQGLGQEMADAGLLPVDVPRRPSGRAEPAAAEERFERARAQMSATSEDWRQWFLLSIAYDDCRDRRRARQAMRRAIALHRSAGMTPA